MQDPSESNPRSTSLTQIQIAKICDEVKDLLLKKNQSYGDAALSPIRCFSEASPIEQIKVRIDDKLSRIKSGSGIAYMDEDTLMDLIGYCILLKIAENRQKVVNSPISCSSTSWLSWDEIQLDHAYAYYDHGSQTEYNLNLRNTEDLKFLEQKWRENPGDANLYSVWAKGHHALYHNSPTSDT